MTYYANDELNLNNSIGNDDKEAKRMRTILYTMFREYEGQANWLRILKDFCGSGVWWNRVFIATTAKGTLTFPNGICNTWESLVDFQKYKPFKYSICPEEVFGPG